MSIGLELMTDKYIYFSYYIIDIGSTLITGRFSRFKHQLIFQKYYYSSRKCQSNDSKQYASASSCREQ
jgi:hypothetical protein